MAWKGEEIMASIEMKPKDFLALFYNLYFLRTSFNEGYLMNIKITCPLLTEEDIKGSTIECLSGLEESGIVT